MPAEFARSARGTIGLEWELSLVDPVSGELAPRAGELLAAVGGRADGPIRGEYLQTMIELTTGVHTSVPDAVNDLRRSLEVVLTAADDLGVAVIGAGTHPFSRAVDQPVSRDPRYGVVHDRNGYWGERMVINGTHIHVGVDDADAAVQVTSGLTRFYSHFLALSASSPFWEGADTGFASHRTMMFRQLDTSGRPVPMADWADFVAHVDELAEVGLISGDPSEIRWDVRPAPKFGTVENRIPDASPTLTELGCLAAWSQCLTEHLRGRIAAGETIEPWPAWLVRENKWRAARYGLEAELIQPGSGRKLLPLRESIVEWLAELTPIAARLGCSAELATTRQILDDGASYQRQRRIAERADLRAVVSALVDELRGVQELTTG